MAFLPFRTTQFDPTTFVRLPESLTDCDAVPRETQIPVATLKSPPACSPELQESRKECKRKDKQVEALRRENHDLKLQVEDLQRQVFDRGVKAAAASPPAKKVRMIDQEVQATEGDLAEHIGQLREDMRELRVQKKSLQAHVSQQQDVLLAHGEAAAKDEAAAVQAWYVRCMEATQEL